MLATILKSEQAVKTTLAIIETFAKIRNLSRNMQALSTSETEPKQKDLFLWVESPTPFVATV